MSSGESISELNQFSREFAPPNLLGLTEDDLESLGLDTGQRHNKVVSWLDVRFIRLVEFKGRSSGAENGGDNVVKLAIGEAIERTNTPISGQEISREWNLNKRDF